MTITAPLPSVTPVDDRRTTGLSVVLWLAGLATFGILYAPQGLLPQMSTALALDPVQASWVMSAATLALAVSIIPWVLVSDRIGRRRALQLSALMAAVFALCGPLLPGYTGLLVGRVLLGVALAGLPALAMTYLHEAASARKAPALAAGYIAATSVGGLIGRIGAPPLAELTDWRTSLVLLGGAAAVLCGLVAWLLPPAETAPTTVGASMRTLARQAINPRLLPLYAIGACSVGAMVATFNALVFRLEAAPYALAPSVASLVFLCYFAGTATSRLSSTLLRTAGPRVTLALGGALVSGGIVLTLASPLWLVIVGVGVLTSGMFLAHSAANSHVARVSPEGRQHAVALYSVTYYVGSSLFGAAGAVAWVSGGWPALTATVCALGLSVVALSAAVGRHQA